MTDPLDREPATDQPESELSPTAGGSEASRGSDGTNEAEGADDTVGDTGPSSFDEAVEAVEADLAALAKERDEYLDALRRLQADFDNFRKRMMRQQAESVERAAEALVADLLPALDAIDLAEQHGQAEAVAPVAAPLREVLDKAGLERVDPVGQPFDPEEHEAVAHEPGDGADDGNPVVVSLMRAGYRWKGRLLRAAMVGVRG